MHMGQTILTEIQGTAQFVDMLMYAQCVEIWEVCTSAVLWSPITLSSA